LLVVQLINYNVFTDVSCDAGTSHFVTFFDGFLFCEKPVTIFIADEGVVLKPDRDNLVNRRKDSPCSKVVFTF